MPGEYANAITSGKIGSEHSIGPGLVFDMHGIQL